MPEEITAWDELVAFCASAPKEVTTPLLQKLETLVDDWIMQMDAAWHMQDKDTIDLRAGEKTAYVRISKQLDNLLRPPKEEEESPEADTEE